MIRAKYTNEEKQVHVERYVFDAFAQRAALELRSVKHSAPDFECRVADGSTVRFELVGLDAEPLQRQISAQDRSDDAWQCVSNALRTEERAMLADAYIAVSVVGTPGPRDRVRIFREVVDLLLERPAGFAGMLVPYDTKATSVRRTEVIRDQPDGPLLRATTADRPYRVDWTRIRTKLCDKHYRTGGRLELVAYSLFDCVLPYADDRVPIEAIKDWLGGSDVACVWIYDRFLDHRPVRIDRT